MRPDAAIDTCVRAHEALLAALAPLHDADFQVASLLPHYSRGHVVTHLANKARAHVWVLGGPSVGEVRRLHPAGYDADCAADAGAHRSAAELRAVLTQSFEQLEVVWGRVAGDEWDQLGVMTAGPRPMTEIVDHHMRNVLVHHLDLESDTNRATGRRTSSKASCRNAFAHSPIARTMPSCWHGSSGDRLHASFEDRGDLARELNEELGIVLDQPVGAPLHRCPLAPAVRAAGLRCARAPSCRCGRAPESAHWPVSG